jgi:ribonuclease D
MTDAGEVGPEGIKNLPTIARGDLPVTLLDAYRRSVLVAWDIETSGLDWRQAQIGTCQLFAPGIGAAVISLTSGARPTGLVSLLEDPRVSKVFHHAPFDLRFMMHAWGVKPASIRCTKVASKLVEPAVPNDVHSLQSLVARYLGVNLQKGEIRTSDWTADSLSPEQVQYAAADVLYLPALLASLNARLAALGLGWLYDRCCEFLPARAVLELGDYPDVFAY